MLSTVRTFVVAGCAALLLGSVATSASATSAAPAAAQADFSVHPIFGRVGSTITLSGADFSTATGVTIHGVSATFTQAPPNLKVVVPDGARSGKVVVTRTTPAPTRLNGPRFTVQQVTSTISSTSKGVITFGHSLLVKAHERYASTHDPVAGQQAVLQHRAAGRSAWHRAPGTHAQTTGKQGGVQWSVRPHSNGSYRVYFRQSHERTSATTGAHSVRVLPRLHVRSLTTVAAQSTSHIRGAIHPKLGGRVALQRKNHGHWRTVQRQRLSDGHFSFPIHTGSVGQLNYRVTREHDATHGRATSPTLHIEVTHRTLSLGDSGADVKALQKRLHHLHYDVGPRNGDYGYDTLHAVTAFEKQNGLAKDGTAGTAVWKKLGNPKRYHLRHAYRHKKLAVEVNLSKQLLILARHGKVWRILDTSTAGGYYFTNSEGQQEKAVTPRGHFTIQYKLTGWHKSDLGELYYPSYFTNTGYAIHGEGNGNGSDNVPPYPNSHGCVRITNNAVLRYYDDLAVGTSVWIYQ